MSPQGLELLEAREGKKASMYRDSAGLPTIGVGHRLTQDELSSGKLHLGDVVVDWRIEEQLTEDEIAALLRQDLGRVEAALNSWAVIQVPLTQQQFDTLASFTFNVSSLAIFFPFWIVLKASRCVGPAMSSGASWLGNGSTT